MTFRFEPATPEGIASAVAGPLQTIRMIFDVEVSDEAPAVIENTLMDAETAMLTSRRSTSRTNPTEGSSSERYI